MIYLCDFDDSFTYNIYADLIEMKKEVEVIPFKEIYLFLQTKLNSNSKDLIILGPGPGHPDEYDYLLSSIKSIIEHESLHLMGICLGHQLIWQAQGFNCTHSSTPVHGQVQTLYLDEFWRNYLAYYSADELEVQRYNSLAIHLDSSVINQLSTQGWRLHTSNNELLMSVNDNESVFTYQFHPESVGTSCHKSFYTPISKL